MIKLNLLSLSLFFSDTNFYQYQLSWEMPGKAKNVQALPKRQVFGKLSPAYLTQKHGYSPTMEKKKLCYVRT